MNIRYFFINPFFYYSLSFILGLFLYSFGWSGLYPELSSNLLFFLLSTIIISLAFSIFFIGKISESFLIFYNYRKSILISDLNLKIIMYIIYILIVLEYIYSGGIPLLMVLMGREFNYKDFGIPTLHVFISPYLSILCTTFFIRYAISKENKYLKPIFIIIIYMITIYSRAGIFFVFFSFLMVYLSMNFSLKKMMLGLILSLSFLYAFGVAGDNRMKALGYGGDNNRILILGKASKDFETSIIPNEFFWSYLYISSPIANLQYKDNTYVDNNFISTYLLSTVIPDAISKRINEYNGGGISNDRLLDENLNVSSMYGASMQLMHYEGSIFTFIYYLFFTTIAIIFCSKRFRLAMFAVLSIMSILAIFDNLLHLSGFIMQPIILLVFGRITLRNMFLI